MLQTKFLLLSLLVSILSLTIISDVFRAKLIARDTAYKLEYLNSIHLPVELAELSKTIESYSKRKTSLAKYNERSKSLKLKSINFEDSLIWAQYIDEGDLSFLKKEISTIQSIPHNNQPELVEIRNKFSYHLLLTYLSMKVGIGRSSMGCYFSKYIIFKDLSNNLTLSNESSDRVVEILSINKQMISHNSLGIGDIIRIPIADTLDIMTRTYQYDNNYLLPDSDTLIHNYKEDISQIPDGCLLLKQQEYFKIM